MGWHSRTVPTCRGGLRLAALHQLFDEGHRWKGWCDLGQSGCVQLRLAASFPEFQKLTFPEAGVINPYS